MAVPNAFDERSIPNLPGVERGDIDLNKTEPKTAVKTGRVQWIDFAKGIAILATILGHTADVGKNRKRCAGIDFFLPHAIVFYPVDSDISLLQLFGRV